MTIPKPGVYFDVPFDDYLAWDAVSNSRLGLAKRSAAHYQAGFQGEGSSAMRLGSLVHAGVLEPLAIAKRYIFQPDYSKHEGNVTANGERSYSASTKFVKSMEDQFRKLHHDKEILSEPQYEKMLGIARSLHNNDLVRDLMRNGRAEVSVVWSDLQTGLLCKMRADWLRTQPESSESIVIDLKTTVDASEFERSIVRYGYYRQMAFYRRGIAATCGTSVAPWIIAVESSAPYGCRVAPIDELALVTGESEVDELLSFVAECKALDFWPGYSNPDSWKLPGWFTKNLGDVELIVDGEVFSV